ncbi:NADP-dependent oxidoreductase [Pantoea stewartii]|uniref:NADP-dependent oxidoreductase n=1 Tax=Pantoea stewartii TaxID=66269 RepID=UPI001624A4DE|nr:NADP-dependent oxidoreductase [Pantoea stewartii]MBC0856526.1 NADP-dependent oxidoreductase [Pantoea stewartii]
MKAILIPTFGGAENIQIENIVEPECLPDEVVVKVEAVGLNPLDIKIMAGYMEQVFPVRLPYIPGTDFSGVVKKVGAEIKSLRQGDRVVGRTAPQTGGALASHLSINGSELVKIPDEMSFEQAAALPTSFGTAYQALFSSAHLSAGQRVLIHAGAGGVGAFAIQLAKQAGAEVVTTVSEKNVDLVRSLGADEIINYRTQLFTDINPVNVVIDTIGGETLERSWQVLKSGGRIASLTDFSIEDREGKHGEFVFFANAVPGLEKAMQYFRADNLQIITDSIYSLENSRGALERVASGHACGKVIIRTAH